ncbi:CotH kinase family protein [Cytobacillus solani]|uniref:CotH kinase family protein n=1 Tax=Cytobacillus solani TaxID=1637975 RepID=UPI002079E615|nr:CotH kinase family protein [Cytobacillus solani]USK53118.1 CotH kinase family protein [Cytobacillus solani]
MKKYILWFSLIASILMISGCTDDIGMNKEDKNEIPPVQTEDSEEKVFGEDPRLYEFEKKDSVVTFYITIGKENEASFYELNNWYSIHNSETTSPKLDIMIQAGTAKGIKEGLFGFDETEMNASIQLRGKSTRVAAQKSFKIKLYDSAGLWRGQKTLNLNKHPYDATRVRNKLSFDYFTKIPGLTSMRTQFVHLYVKDLTKKDSNGKFEDYGLYTQIEQANERFLAAHGLDSNGNLYKATNFEFFRYHDQLKLETDSLFNKDEFEMILESKGSNDHRKLLTMLDDVNNQKLNINEVVERHFDKENYLTWIATNILMGNSDVTTQNFYLYCPSNSEKWYFLPWDYDGAWRSSPTAEKHSELADWQDGLSNYWGSVLHKRFFKDPKNVEVLTKKIEELTAIINPETTKKLLDQYYQTVSQFVKKSPDKDYLDVEIADFDDVYYGIVNESLLNKEVYYKNLEKPMPFFLDDYKNEKNQHVFTWDPSYDIQGDDLFYTLQISTDPAFSHIVHEKKDMIETQYAYQLSKGTYYWRVVAKDAKNNVQTAFDLYEDEDGSKYFGVKKMIVN